MMVMIDLGLVLIYIYSFLVNVIYIYIYNLLQRGSGYVGPMLVSHPMGPPARA